MSKLLSPEELADLRKTSELFSRSNPGHAIEKLIDHIDAQAEMLAGKDRAIAAIVKYAEEMANLFRNELCAKDELFPRGSTWNV